MADVETVFDFLFKININDSWVSHAKLISKLINGIAFIVFDVFLLSDSILMSHS